MIMWDYNSKSYLFPYLSIHYILTAFKCLSIKALNPTNPIKK